MAEGQLRVAVTGAAGRIGSVVARRLAEQGHAVVLLDQREPTSPPAGARVVVLDGRDADAVARAIAGVDAVCHLGERAGVPRDGSDPNETIEHNLAATRAVIAACGRNDVRRVVYAGTFQRYGLWGSHLSSVRNGGFTPKRLPFDEDEPANPQNAYAISKTRNEGQFQAFAEANAGRRAIVLRLPFVLQPADAELAARIWRTADTDPHRGAGTYVHVRDVAEAFALAVRADRPLVEAPAFLPIHLAAAEVAGDLSVREKIATLNLDWPSLPDEWPARAPPVSTARARRFLGWRPIFAIDPPSAAS